MSVPPRAQREILELMNERDRRMSRRSFFAMFPDEDMVWTGPKTAIFERGERIYARRKYKKALAVFEATATYRETNIMAANRVGKTVACGYAVACWATGMYPPWWTGRRFDGPIDIWVAGQTNETTRDILQRKLFGDVVLVDGKKGLSGTGIIPGDMIINPPAWKAGVTDLIDNIGIRCQDGGISRIGMKSYQQGRISFEGLEKHVCIAEGELVHMADGTLRPIEFVSDGDKVITLNGNGCFREREVIAVHRNGERECIEVIPKHGNTIILTPDHKIYRGYNLKNKVYASCIDKVAQPMPGLFWPMVIADRDDAWYIWSALVIAEGTVSQKKVTNSNIEVMERAISFLPAEARVRRENFNNGHVPDWFLYWDEFWSEVSPALSHQKSIPDWIFTSSKEKVRLFLRWLYMGDGWANGNSVGYATTSRVLQNQIVVLLNRLGIRASVYIRKPAKLSWRGQYWVSVHRASDVLLFLSDIGIEGKEESVALVGAEALRMAVSKSRRGMHFRRATVKECRSKTKILMERQRLKTSKVRCIKEIGVRKVYDLTVDVEHRFIVGTSIVSNCLLDEEPPMEIYGECLIRTMTVKGAVLLSAFTPLLGLSETARLFLPDGNV